MVISEWYKHAISWILARWRRAIGMLSLPSIGALVTWLLGRRKDYHDGSLSKERRKREDDQFQREKERSAQSEWERGIDTSVLQVLQRNNAYYYGMTVEVITEEIQSLYTTVQVESALRRMSMADHPKVRESNGRWYLVVGPAHSDRLW